MKYTSSDGYHVFIAGGHLEQHLDVVPFLTEAVSKVRCADFTDATFSVKVDMGRIIGKTVCVATTLGDEIVFARRVGRHTLTRFVKNREPIDTRFITLVLVRKPKCFYLISAYIGTPAPREPDDRGITSDELKNQSRNFWAEHALIFGSQQIQ